MPEYVFSLVLLVFFGTRTQGMEVFLSVPNTPSANAMVCLLVVVVVVFSRWTHFLRTDLLYTTQYQS